MLGGNLMSDFISPLGLFQHWARGRSSARPVLPSLSGSGRGSGRCQESMEEYIQGGAMLEEGRVQSSWKMWEPRKAWVLSETYHKNTQRDDMCKQHH